MSTEPTPGSLVDEATKILSTYVTEGRTRTDLLKQLAKLVVELRLQHQLSDGRPDLGGRSAAYRADIASIYDGAKVPKDDYDGIQTALRYHVNNRLHEIRSAEELTAAGLSAKLAKERLAADREAAAMLRAVAKDPALLADHIAELIERLDVGALTSGTTKRAEAARTALVRARDGAEKAIAAIDAALPAGSSGP